MVVHGFEALVLPHVVHLELVSTTAQEEVETDCTLAHVIPIHYALVRIEPVVTAYGPALHRLQHQIQQPYDS